MQSYFVVLHLLHEASFGPFFAAMLQHSASILEARNYTSITFSIPTADPHPASAAPISESLQSPDFPPSKA